MERRQGFTLIELSIVLVIIGLIVGGILVGRDLIETAQIRATIAQYEKFRVATNTFRQKYKQMPGDMTEQRAAAFGFEPTARPGAALVYHGNGILENGGSSNVLAHEWVTFWRDLSSAALIEGGFRVATDGPAASLTAQQIASYLPQAKLGPGYWAAAGGDGRNYFSLVGITATDASGDAVTEFVLTGQQAYSIDVKLDDGTVLGNIRPNIYDYDAYVWLPDTLSYSIPCAGLAGYTEYVLDTTDYTCGLQFLQ